MVCLEKEAQKHLLEIMVKLSFYNLNVTGLPSKKVINSITLPGVVEAVEILSLENLKEFNLMWMLVLLLRKVPKKITASF